MAVEYSIHNGILFRAHLIIIPKSLQFSILQELHSTHLCIVKMKSDTARGFRVLTSKKSIESLHYFISHTYIGIPEELVMTIRLHSLFKKCINLLHFFKYTDVS